MTLIAEACRSWSEKEANGCGEIQHVKQVLLISPSSFDISSKVWGPNSSIYGAITVLIDWYMLDTASWGTKRELDTNYGYEDPAV